MYNGQLDIIVGVPLTEAYLQKLVWSGFEQYLNVTKTVWRINPTDVEAAGYARTVGDFVQVGKDFNAVECTVDAVTCVTVLAWQQRTPSM